MFKIRIRLFFIYLTYTLTPQILFSSESFSRKISQIIIVYSPKEDWNGAFHSFHEDLTDLFEAAEEKNMRIVLIDADNFEGPNSRDLLKKSIQAQVNTQPSILILATHGGQIKNEDGSTDTSLSFPGGFAFSDLSKTFENPNLSGVLLESCHSGSSLLKDLGQKTFTCAISQSDKVGSTKTASVIRNILIGAIQTGKVKDLGAFMKKRALSKPQILNEKLLGDKMDQEIPIYGPSHFAVEFSGSKYEIVDSLGNSISPCFSRAKNKRIESLPSQILPPGGMDRILISKKVPFYFNNRTEIKNPEALSASCNRNGQITIHNATSFCSQSKKILFGKQCEESLTSLLNQGQTRKKEKQIFAPQFNSTAKLYCEELNETINEWKSRDVLVEASYICANEKECTFYDDDEVYRIGLGQCSQTGGICLPTPTGAHIFESSKCAEIMKIENKKNSECLSREGNKVSSGKCFIPAYIEKKHFHNGLYDYYVRLPTGYSEVDFHEAEYLAQTKIKAFRCSKNLNGETLHSFDKDCCLENGGHVVEPPKDNLENNRLDFSGITDNQIHQIFLKSAIERIVHCKKNQNSTQPEPNMDKKIHSGSFSWD